MVQIAKQPRVWSGTAWEPLAVTLPDLSNYSTTTQMNTAIDNAKGLVLVNKTDVSAVSSISINNVFTSTYENYLISIVSTYSVGASSVHMRLRVGGVDNSTASSYRGQILRSASGSVGGFTQSSTEWGFGDTATTITNHEVTLNKPAVAVPTGFLMRMGTPAYAGISGGDHNVSTAYDGVTIYPSSGTMTGTIRIYGYRNS